jgi:hypothetical protein
MGCIAHMRNRAKGATGSNQEKTMKTIFAAVAIAMAITTPVLAQNAQTQQSAQWYQGGTYQGYPASEWYRQDSW